MLKDEAATVADLALKNIRVVESGRIVAGSLRCDDVRRSWSGSHRERASRRFSDQIAEPEAPPSSLVQLPLPLLATALVTHNPEFDISTCHHIGHLQKLSTTSDTALAPGAVRRQVLLANGPSGEF